MPKLKDNYQADLDAISENLIQVKFLFNMGDPFLSCLENILIPELKAALDITEGEFILEFMGPAAGSGIGLGSGIAQASSSGSDSKKKSSTDLKLNTLLSIFRAQYDQAFNLNFKDGYHKNAPQIYAKINEIYFLFSKIKKDFIKRTFEMKFNFRGKKHDFKPMLEPLNGLDLWFSQRLSIFEKQALIENSILGLKSTAEALRSNSHRLVWGSKILFSTYESELKFNLDQLQKAVNNISAASYAKKASLVFGCGLIPFTKDDRVLSPSVFLDLNDKIQGSMETIRRIGWIRGKIL